MTSLTVKIVHSIHEVNEGNWDELSADRPFQSHRWYAFGESVMNDCAPLYLLVYQGDMLVGRASLWKIHNEPLPTPPGIVRAILTAILRCWPLLICRSPLSNASGVILPPGPLHEEALRVISDSALKLSKQEHCLALIFDFLSKRESENWLDGYASIEVPDPGTILQNRWRTLDEYLADGNKKDRQHYKRTLREAEKLGITVERHAKVYDVDAALALIHNMDRRYGNPPNPWMRPLLEKLETADGLWLEAKQHGKLVGCGALLFDNETQLTTALGLAEGLPYVYLTLAYVCLEEAFARGVRTLRWGSGAYDLKQKFGFEMEDNNNAAVTSGNFLMKQLLSVFS